MGSEVTSGRTLSPRPPETGLTPWLVVLGSTLALVVGNGPIILFTFGVLLQPISDEFQWQRSVLASAVVTSHVTGAVVMPFMGTLMDRIGVRMIALPAIVIFAAATAAGGLLGPNPLHFIVLYGLLGVIGAGHSTLTYARVVSGWFDARRGLALGITLAGIGIGAAVLPKYTQYFVAASGWREAYFALGALLLVLGFPAVAVLVKDSGRGRKCLGDKAGLTLAQTLRTRQFWLTAGAVMIVAAAVNGTIAHIVPILSDRGIARDAATTAVAAAGFSLIAGRMLSGFALDRLFAMHVAAFFFAVPLAGMTMLGAGVSGAWAVLAAVLLGLGIGAEGDIMAYLTGRYFGMAHFGVIYGCILAFFTLGSGVGPWLMAHAFDSWHSYIPGLIGLGAATAGAIAMIAGLGPYRYPPPRRG
jgi:predicted MFS family arabinose efflux permease